MRHDLALPASICLLAAAIFVHATAPAVAQEPPPAPPAVAAPAPVAAAPAAPVGAACKPIRLGTAREYERAIDELTAEGRDGVLVIDSGLVCAWQTRR